MRRGGVDYANIQTTAGVDQVHSTCASICAGLCAVQKGILTPCKRLITTQSYSIAKKRYGRRLRAYRIYK